MRTVELEERDGFMSRFLHVAIACDPFMDPYVTEGGMIRTVFAWGHPVLKITGPGVVQDQAHPPDQRPASWQWLGLDDATEPEDLTRQREVVAEFLVELGMLGQPESYEEAHERFKEHLGNYEPNNEVTGATHEQEAFDLLFELMGEHDLPVWVDSVIHRTPLLEYER